MREKLHSFLIHGQQECQRSLSIAMSISLNTLKLHNERLDKLLYKLEENFSGRPVTPSDSIETIMYRAGQASVIEYLKSIMEDEI